MSVTCAAELKAQEGYDAHERRALTAKGDIRNMPVPGWLSTSHGAGRAGCKKQLQEQLAAIGTYCINLHQPARQLVV
jgi:hypothetical protein